MKQPAAIASLVDEIRAAPFFSGMSAKQRELLASCATHSSFDAGELIFREGDHANRFYLIQSGAVCLETNSSSGKIMIETLGDGEALGWSWLFPPFVWHFDARACEPSKVIFFYGTRLREFCDQDARFGYELVKRMSEILMRRLESTREQLARTSELVLKTQALALQAVAQEKPRRAIAPEEKLHTH